jgi:DNA-binding CsgD family transcriptional regulator
LADVAGTEQLDKIVRLLTVMVTRDLDQQKDKIAVLSNAGFQPKEIAELIDTTPHTVNVTLSSMRKARKSKKR